MDPGHKARKDPSENSNLDFQAVGLPLGIMPLMQLVTCRSGRTLVFDQPCNFRCPALDLQLMGDHLCG